MGSERGQRGRGDRTETHMAYISLLLLLRPREHQGSLRLRRSTMDEALAPVDT